MVCLGELDMQKPKSFRPWLPDQITLLLTSSREWLAEDYQGYFMLDPLQELDFSESTRPFASQR